MNIRTISHSLVHKGPPTKFPAKGINMGFSLLPWTDDKAPAEEDSSHLANTQVPKAMVSARSSLNLKSICF